MLVIALVVIGPERLPEVLRASGKILRELRSASNEVMRELTDALEEQRPNRIRPPTEDKPRTERDEPTPPAGQA